MPCTFNVDLIDEYPKRLPNMVNASWIDRILARPQLEKFYFY